MHTRTKELHVLLTQSGMAAQKSDLVAGASNGRTESSRELTEVEAKALCDYLRGKVSATSGDTWDRGNRMRRRIISMAHEMHWHIDGTSKIDMQRVNEWCMKYSYLKQPLGSYTLKELPKLVTQFEIVYKRYLHNIS